MMKDSTQDTGVPIDASDKINLIEQSLHLAYLRRVKVGPFSIQADAAEQLLELLP
jgi:hypothetical protein